MANVKAGVIGAIATAVVFIVEALLYPIVLNFLTTFNNSGNACQNSTGGSGNCVANPDWFKASDQTILASAPTLMIVVMIMTLLGGLIGSIYLAIKG